jgi:hypothetical protein
VSARCRIDPVRQRPVDHRHHRIIPIRHREKNAIDIDFALDAERNEGMSRATPFSRPACRFRPIMMTTMAAILERCR